MMNNNGMVYQIDGRTQLICLLGSPVAHSKSPLMHNEAFRSLGLNYAYLAFEVGEDKLDKAVDGLVTLGARGWNLTMPNKNKMAGLCDELSVAAQIGGTVNTVVVENGRLIGHTTDGIGFLRSCEEEGVSIQGKKLTQLGSGGAGMSILVQAALDGAREISLFSRKSSPFYARMMEIVHTLNERTACKVTHYEYHDDTLKKELADSDLLINATNIGMAPDIDRCLIPDTSFLPSTLAVADVIYNPAQTKLMKLAASAGCKNFNGLYMLLYQGAEAFKIWTGQEMPVALIKEKYFS